MLSISLATISRYVKLKASGEDLAPKPSPGRKAKIMDSLAHKRALWRQLEDGGALRDVREETGGLPGDDEPRGQEARVDFQKRSMASSERDEQRRGAFREHVSSILSERFVFVDECSTNISLSPIYARAPRNWGKKVSLVCAIDSEGVKPSMSVSSVGRSW